MRELRVDGGPARNRYLMQFQSDISGKTLKIPQAEELSGIGAAYMAGISAGLYSEEELFLSLIHISPPLPTARTLAAPSPSQPMLEAGGISSGR